MRQQFEVALVLHNEMNKINCACHTREGQVSPLNVNLNDEQLKKNQDPDENVAK